MAKGLTASKTIWAALIGYVNAVAVLVPGVMAGDPSAIGQAVLATASLAGVVYGRLRAEVPVRIGG